MGNPMTLAEPLPAWWVGRSIGHTGRAAYHHFGSVKPPASWGRDSVQWEPLYTHPPGGRIGVVIDEGFVVRMLDHQPLADRNLGDRLWQFLAAGGLKDGEQIEALLGALRHAMGDRA